MNEQEALDFLKNNEEKRVAGRYIRIKAMANKSLEKQIPKKPIKEITLNRNKKIGGMVLSDKCPSCRRIIRIFETANYCMFCGQSILWEEEE